MAVAGARGVDDRGPNRAPELTVILCVHNGAGTVRHQLEALATQEWSSPWEVLIVDNASTDATPDIIEEFVSSHPLFRSVAARERLGLSYARNVGVKNTTAAAVAFCDDDDLVGEGWVAAMGNALREYPIVACRFDWNRLAGAPDGIEGGVFQQERVEQLFGYPIAAGVGGWQRWLWEALGGNDESLTSTGEDFDMSIRAHLKYDLTPHFEPDAVYHIARRADARSNFRQARAYGRSSVTLYRRYGRGRVDRRAELSRSLRSWAWLGRHVFDLRRSPADVAWARRAGIRVGRLEESLRSRTLWP